MTPSDGNDSQSVSRSRETDESQAILREIRTMKRSVLIVTSIGLLGVLSLIGISIYRWFFQRTGLPISPPVTSPIVVKGGSVDVEAPACLYPTGINPSVSSYVMQADGPNLFLYIDNVTVATPKPIKLNSEWTVTLTFTDSGPENHSITLQGKTPFSGGLYHQIEMTGDDDGQWTNFGNCPISRGSYASMNFQAQHCGGSPGQYGPGTEPKCNHLSKILLTPGSLTDTSLPTEYDCFSPEQQHGVPPPPKPCEIGISPSD